MVSVFDPIHRQIDQTITVIRDKKIQFRDTGLYIYSSADGQLDIVADTTIAFSGAITMDSTLEVTGDLTVLGNFVFGNAATDELTVNGYIEYGASTADYMIDMNAATPGTADIRLSNGATIANGAAGTLTVTETAIELVGAIKLDGTVTLDDDGTIADASDIMTITQDTITLVGATAITLDGDVSVNAAHTFSTGTGDVTIKGDMSIDAGKDFDMSAGDGTFATGTGAVSINGIATFDLAASFNGDVTIGNASDDSIIFTARLKERLYSNQYDYDKTILKIHNHDTTAEIGSLETKGDLINTTGLVLGQAAYWTYEPTGGTGTPSQLSASENVGAVSPGFTVTAGNLYGLTGHMQCHGTLNGGTVNVAGVIGILSGAGANTHVLHMAGVQSAVSVVNPTTGTLSHYLANTVGVEVIDNLICMQDSQYITNFASFNAAATDKSVEVNTGTPSGAISHIIHVSIAGADGYVPVYSGKPS